MQIRQKLSGTSLAMGIVVAVLVVAIFPATLIALSGLFAFGPPGANRNLFVWLDMLGSFAAPLVVIATAVAGGRALWRGTTGQDFRILFAPAAWLAFMLMVRLASKVLCAGVYSCELH